MLSWNITLFNKIESHLYLINHFWRKQKLIKLYLHLKNHFWNMKWRRRVICSKFICSKKLLDSKISTARHCSIRWQKYINLLENQKSMPYMSCRAYAFFRPKCATARIATARIATAWQNHWKMSTARIKKSWKVWNMYGSLVKKQSKLG